MRASCTVFLLQQAAKCRRLARIALDKDVSVQLLRLAAEYEVKANIDREEPHTVH
jgi:hypothetical protein